MKTARRSPRPFARGLVKDTWKWVFLVSSLAGCEGRDALPPGGSGSSGSGSSGSGTTATSPETSRSVPISGGTLLVTRDGERALVSDPDRDRVLLVDLVVGTVLRELELEPGDEPGRAIEDGSGGLHVVLRGAGELLSLTADGDFVRQRSVCPAPRGLASDDARGLLLVVCASGELATASTSTAAVKRVSLAADLRDIVVTGDRAVVSTFRSAELLSIDLDGQLLGKTSLPATSAEPVVAWRLTEWPGRGVLVAHQRASTSEIGVGPSAPAGAYGVANDPIVEGVVTGVGTADPSNPLVELGAQGPLTVDVDSSEDGLHVAMVSAGAQTVTLTDLSGGAQVIPFEEQPIAVQMVGQLALVQFREPSELRWVSPGNSSLRIPLGGADVSSVGHQLFHGAPDGPAKVVTCASCHPEGREDGHVWNFQPMGPRRTQTLLGGVGQTAPFHWDGDFVNMDRLFDEVMSRRMGNRGLSAPESDAFAEWLDGLAALPKRDVGELDPGRLAFEKAGCSSCHSGERFTNGGSADVGTGIVAQTPSLLGLAYRAPYMHDGCATTIEDRFGPCGGDSHGDVEALSSTERAALLGYLQGL